MSKATDIIKEVEQELLEKLKEGKSIWDIPYILEDFYNNNTEKKYNGINQYILAKSMNINGFTSSKWATFKQLQAKKIKLKKGSKSTQIVFFSVIDRKEEGKEDLKFWKYYNVFNLSQTENYIQEKKETKTLDNISKFKNLKNIAKSYLQREKISLAYNNTMKPNYSPSSDKITVPEIDHFKTEKGFISTLLHEVAHSTGIKKRLNRNLEKYSVSKNNQSKEEILAELTATLFLKKNGLEVSNNYEYLKSWYKYLNTQKIKITSILNASVKAYNYINNIK